MRKTLLLAFVLLCQAIAPAHAFDPSRYGSPIFANPQVDKLLAQGGGTITPLTVYRASYPGVNFSDTVQAVLDVPAGAQQENLSAFGAYMRTKSGGSGNPDHGGNAVGHFATGFIDADNSAMWGVNTLITDNSSRTVASGGTGRIAIGAELDFNVMRTTTQLIGVSVGGNSNAQPANANAFLVNTLGNGNKWGTGFWSLDGAATQGLVLGALSASGTNVGSQLLWLQSYDASGTKRVGQIQQSGSYMVVQDFAGQSWSGLLVRKGDVSLDGGQSIRINNQAVLGSRQGGWTQGTGTPNLGAFNADYVPTFSATYTQGEMQALQTQLLSAQRRVLAVENAMRSHGLIGN